MPSILRNLKILEVSSVDRGAGEGVRIVLMKRDAEVKKAWHADFIDGAAKLEDAEAAAYCKREFSDEQREHLANTGAAMPGGGFPIENTGDLKNAIHAVGRAKDPDAAKAHIKARAKALGAEGLLPDTWKRGPDDIDLASIEVGKDDIDLAAIA